MSTDKNLELLATIIDQYCECCEPRYELPYTHNELIEILSRIRQGVVLTEEEYNALRLILYPGDNDNNIEGDVLFSGDYLDLKNKPFIPKNMSDLKDYPTIMQRINQMINALSDKDIELAEKISDNARFISAIEIVVTDELERLSKLIDACRLFQGESLDDVIANIQAELDWLDLLREDLDEGKVLSEKDFTATYEEILKSIVNTADGLTGYIKKVIAESIIEPGEPNGNGVYRLDSIGEALATKVDKIYGYGLSKNDFSDKYKEILDSILNRNGEGTGTLTEYIVDIIDRYEEEFDAMISDVAERMNEYTENAIQEMKAQIGDIKEEVRNEIDDAKQTMYDGVLFKEGDGPTTVAVGGMNKGTELKGKSARQVLLEILCPFTTPIVSAELVLAHPQYLYRIGDIVEVKGIQANIERGSLPIKRVAFKKRIGNTYEVLGAYSGSNVTSFWFEDIFELTSSTDTNYFIVEVEDTEGNVSVSGTDSIDFVYPVFYGNLSSNIAINDINEYTVRSLHEVLKRPGEECKLEYTTQFERIVLAIPENYGRIEQIYDQNGYIITNSFDVKTVTLTFEIKEAVGKEYIINRYTQQYYVYYNNPSTVYGFEITYQF
jgi:phosphoribosylaminoimidazole-succinocarboxamide synthase